MQWFFVFIVLFLSIAVNLPDSFISRMDFDADALMAALVAVVITGLISNRNLLLIVLVLSCSILANLPVDIMNMWGLQKDYFFGILVALVVVPVGEKITRRK